MDSLVKAGALYGVEIWGWRRREGIEKLQGKFVKMALGVARDTPDYIWKLEAGKRSVELETRKRAAKYIVEISKMKEDRWPKVCLKEEIRGIINTNPSQWGREFKQALEEVGGGKIVGAIWKESEWREVLILLEEGLKRKEEQDTQGDWVKVDKSSFCKLYGEIKKTVDREKYWDKKGINGTMKEEWARLRCGNIGKVGKKGYGDSICRICGKKDKSINHVWMCKDATELIKDEWVRGVDEWRRKNRERTKLETTTHVGKYDRADDRPKLAMLAANVAIDIGPMIDRGLDDNCGPIFGLLYWSQNRSR